MLNNSSIQPYCQFFCFSVFCIPHFADQIHQDPVPLLCPFLKFKVFIWYIAVSSIQPCWIIANSVPRYKFIVKILWTVSPVQGNKRFHRDCGIYANFLIPTQGYFRRFSQGSWSFARVISSEGGVERRTAGYFS